MPDTRRLALSAAERILPEAVMRRARVAKFDRQRRRYPRRIVEHEYAGVRHRVLIASPYGEQYDSEWPELKEIAWLKRHGLRPGARVFDLGASAGVVAMMLADVVGPSGQVVALEAHPDDAANLSRNQQLNGLDQLMCVHAAIARESGQIVFGRHGSVDDGSRRWGDLRVPSISVDDLAREHGHPDVVFVDVEGYECEALRGASATLEHGPDWFVEVHGAEQLGMYEASPEDVIGCLREAGYALFAAPDSPYVRLPDGSVAPQYPIQPLEDWPAELVQERFFLLATRAPRQG